MGDAGWHRHSRVRSRAITLNHDARRWLSLGLPGDLPAVVRGSTANGSEAVTTARAAQPDPRPQRPCPPSPSRPKCHHPAYQLTPPANGRAVTGAFCMMALQERRTAARRLIPWPWTLASPAAPGIRDTRQQPGGHPPGAGTAPANRIDAGLGQVNLGSTTARRITCDPARSAYRNLAIAAEICRTARRARTGWVAIGRYHRPAGGAPAARYRRQRPPAPDPRAPGRALHFPLAQGSMPWRILLPRPRRCCPPPPTLQDPRPATKSSSRR